MKKIILIGNGWAGTSFIKHINPNEYEIIVISPQKQFVYTPLLVSSIFYDIDVKYAIENIAKIKHNQDKVTSINFNNKYVTLQSSQKEIKYDYLILAHGSEVNTFNIPGVKENCFFINQENINPIKNKISSLKKNSNIIIIGCGLTGSELIGNFIDKKKYNIHIIDGLNNPLSMFNQKLYIFARNLWEINDVHTHFNNFVKKIDQDKIYLNDKSINYNMIFWCGGIKPNLLSNKINNLLSLNCKFGIPIDNKLKVENVHNVFAIGDCGYNGLPPTAQVAYQEGKYLANNFNNNFKNPKDFNFSNKGQICYVGKGISVYQNKHFYFKGKLTGYLNNIIYIYNAINFDQQRYFFKKIWENKFK